MKYIILLLLFSLIGCKGTEPTQIFESEIENKKKHNGIYTITTYIFETKVSEDFYNKVSVGDKISVIATYDVSCGWGCGSSVDEILYVAIDAEELK